MNSARFSPWGRILLKISHDIYFSKINSIAPMENKKSKKKKSWGYCYHYFLKVLIRVENKTFFSVVAGYHHVLIFSHSRTICCFPGFFRITGRVRSWAVRTAEGFQGKEKRHQAFLISAQSDAFAECTGEKINESKSSAQPLQSSERSCTNTFLKDY